MMWYLPSADKSTTVDPRRLWSPIGPPSTTTASLGQSSWNSFRRKNKHPSNLDYVLNHHEYETLTKASLSLSCIIFLSCTRTALHPLARLTCTSRVLVCELMLALVSASGSPHIWQRRLIKAWSGMRTPTSWGTQKHDWHLLINHLESLVFYFQ